VGRRVVRARVGRKEDFMVADRWIKDVGERGGGLIERCS
jgi:hypothetical protein